MQLNDFTIKSSNSFFNFRLCVSERTAKRVFDFSKSSSFEVFSKKTSKLSLRYLSSKLFGSDFKARLITLYSLVEYLSVIFIISLLPRCDIRYVQFSLVFVNSLHFLAVILFLSKAVSNTKRATLDIFGFLEPLQLL